MNRPEPSADPSRLAYNFSIVGVQKGATSTLAGTLNRHRLVCRPPTKEAHFFDDESIDWANPDYERDYTAPRRSPVHRMVGDATPTYLFWPNALERMHAYNPAMPLIAIFRDPIERLFSHWVMLRARSSKRPDWPAFITRFRPTSLPLSVPDDVPLKRYQHQSGVARGFYGEQLERGFAIFPREQWLILEFRQLLASFEPAVDRATDHVGLPRFDTVPPLKNWHPGASLVQGTPPTGTELRELADLYAADLTVFERLSGIDSTKWPTRLLLDGDLDPDEWADRLSAKVAPAE